MIVSSINIRVVSTVLGEKPEAACQATREHRTAIVALPADGKGRRSTSATTAANIFFRADDVDALDNPNGPSEPVAQIRVALGPIAAGRRPLWKGSLEAGHPTHCPSSLQMVLAFLEIGYRLPICGDHSTGKPLERTPGILCSAVDIILDPRFCGAINLTEDSVPVFFEHPRRKKLLLTQVCRGI